MSRPFILGLTGSIGMGKSTVAAMFRELGVPVFDADEAVRRLQGPGGRLLPAIEAEFPGTTGPQGVDRERLGAIVFHDEAAMKQMIGHLMTAYAQSGETTSYALRDAAVASLRGLGERRIYQEMLYRVWMELRLTNVEEGNLTTRQLDTFAVQNGANASVLVPLALPIQFPELKIMRVHTGVIAPAASALRDVSGQDFGTDWDAWAKWVQKQ